jgi:hypothetical protein
VELRGKVDGQPFLSNLAGSGKQCHREIVTLFTYQRASVIPYHRSSVYRCGMIGACVT